MQGISVDEGVRIALDAIHNDRLAILCGAGLSMATPSRLPSAAQIARDAKSKYDSIYGASRPPLPENIEDQAEFFFQRGELGTIYLRTFVDPHAFSGRPNAAHTSVADLLLVSAIQTAASTNVDNLIETAGQMLFGQIGVGVDRNSVSSLLPNRSPLLKIHGCWTIDPDHTIWTPSQFETEPVASRITGNRDWLAARLLDRDLVIIGYWTDWEYINNMLEQTLGNVRPARVVVVDISEPASLQTKAPTLYALGENIPATFYHVNASGDAFLDHLRLEFSRSFVRRILHSGTAAYENSKGSPPDPAWKEPPNSDNESLWQLRRDLEGTLPYQPSTSSQPPSEPLLGLTMLQLNAKGALSDGSHWLLDGRRIRILRSPNKFLYQVQHEFEREDAPVVAPDVVIAVGAEAGALPANIARNNSTNSTIARGSSPQWYTRSEAESEFEL